MRLYRLALLLFCSTLFCGSVSIRNDSPFPLHAQIIAADGTLLGSISVEPQQQVGWKNQNLVVENSPTTPYTVIFYCLEGTEYGIATGVTVGATVFASAVEGKKLCKPQTKKNIKEEQEARKQDPALQNHNADQFQEQQTKSF